MEKAMLTPVLSLQRLELFMWPSLVWVAASSQWTATQHGPCLTQSVSVS